MELTIHELTGKTVAELTTEIKFFIAINKVKENAVFILTIKKTFSGERENKRFASINRILCAVKREGLIQLFIHSKEIDGNTTEAAYINNKYPKLVNEFSENEGFIIKL